MKLSKWIELNNMTRAKFARGVRLSEGMVSLLCRDKAWPSRDSSNRIFVFTDGEVTPNDFLIGEGPRV